MKTISINTYSFNELSEKAKQVAIENYRENNLDNSFIYDEAYQTVKKFNDLFRTSETNRSWLDVNTDHIDDSILELSGLRLHKYLVNNFWSGLYKGKYLGNYHSNHKVNHKRIKANYYPKGAYPDGALYSNFYYSAISFDNCCVLTGVCYDNSMLDPIYKFLENYRDDKNNDTKTFQDLLEECFYSLKKDIESEEEARSEDQYIIEEIENNDYTFLETGETL